MRELIVALLLGQGLVTLQDPRDPSKRVTYSRQDEHTGLDVYLVNPSSSSSGLTDAQLRATPVPVSGTFYPVTQPVSGTLTCNAGTGTLAVSLASAPTTAVTNAGLSNLDVALSTRTKPADQQHTIIDSSATIAVTGPLTDTQLRASAVPVSLASVPTHAVTLTSTTLTGTSAISAASLPLPSGASTSAKQPALGTAGAASADVLTVQGIASMTALKVDGSAVTQPVSGTLTCNAGSGTLAVSGPLTDTQLRANAVPISASSLPLPSGAATAAKQPALGTAGSASADVLSVQGVASMTALKVDGSAVTQPISAAALPTHGVTLAAAAITGSNPCNNPTATLVGISGATSGTASVQLVAISGTTKIYVCSMTITGVSGTSPTFKLQYGTGSACATGTVGIVGPWTTAANTIYNFGGNNFAVTPAGQALCYVQSGTTPVSNYNITYVQQ